MSDMPDLKEKFEEAVKWVSDTPEEEFKPSNETKLEFYSLFKQVTEGDVSGKKPKFTDIAGRAMYGAREKLKGMSKEDAMKRYVKRTNEIKEKGVKRG